MRLLSVRLIISLIVGITLVSLAFSYYEVRSEKRGLTRDLERRAEVLAESLAGNIEPHLAKGSQKELQRIVERFGNRQHLDGVAIYNQKGAPIAVTTGLAHRLPDQPMVVAQAVSKGQGGGQFVHLDHSYVHIYAWPLHQQDQIVGALAIVHDASYIKAQTIQIWRESFLRDLVFTSDFVDYPADCSLEHRRTHRQGGSMDESLANGQRFGYGSGA